MKLKKQTKKSSFNWLDFLEPSESLLGSVYLFIMLGVFPVHVKNQYSKLGDAKFELFWYSTIAFLGLAAVLYLVKRIYTYRKEKDMGKTAIQLSGIRELTFMDLAVFSYGILVTLSYLFSDYKDYALKGAAGWEMGLLSQLSFVGLYFFLSRQKKSYKFILGVHLVVSSLTFILGYLHRFQIDPMAMYNGLNLEQMKEFLSTLGQATWFSSYVCTVFPIGIMLYYVFKNKILKRVAAAYCIVSFAIVVTQNSDSAFIGIVAIFLLLGLYSVKRREDWLRFWEMAIMMWSTFVVTGIFQRIFSEKAIQLDALSVFFSQSIVSWIILAVCIGFYLLYKKLSDEKAEKWMLWTKRVYHVLVITVVVAIAGTIIFIYLNTKGYLLDWFGFQTLNNYLYFDTRWGNLRGTSWLIAWQEFANLSIDKKIIGVGPDAFSAQLYANPENNELLQVYGNLRLTNAHNEYLNSLVCYGIAGLASWLTVLCGGVVYFYKKAKENPIFLGFGLCIIGYACHNIFCYQQVCCTPFLFIAIALGESLTKQIKELK